MKYAVSLVVLALAAVSVESSGLTAQVAPGVSFVTHNVPAAGAAHGAWGGPWWGGAWHGPAAAVDVSGAGPWGWAGHGAYGGWTAYPGVSLSQGPGYGAGYTGAYAGVHGYGHGTYVAKTLGAVHTAPLAGHVNSVKSVNVAPAPGTH